MIRLRESLPPARDLTRVARDIVCQLNAWAAQCPRYREALDDCAEEIAWKARLPPAEAPTEARATELKHGSKQIITTLMLWAELYPLLARPLSSCVEEVEQLAARDERAGDSVRARDQVLLSFEAAEILTSKEIAHLTGLRLRRVQRALQSLERVGLVRDAGCAAQCHSDGFRLRRYKLKHTSALAAA